MKAIQKVGSMALALVMALSLSAPASVSCGGGYDERGNQKTFNY